MKIKKFLQYASVVIVGIFLIYFLKLVFSGELPLSQAFKIGSLTIHYYGLILAAALYGGYLCSQYFARKESVGDAILDQLLPFLFVFGLLGARVYHILSSLGYYQQNPQAIVQVWNGGLSIYGMLFGGLIGLAVFIVYKKPSLSFWKILDLLVPGVLVGQIIGRFGNLFNYELFGYPTSLPWKMFVPGIFRPELFAGNSYFHPLFLYESLLLGLTLAVLAILWKKRIVARWPSGSLFLTYVLLYNTVRFFLEFLRIDSVFIGTFRQNALVSLGLIIVALGILMYRKHAKISQHN
jgi:phosphatidylglycerol:prolipoprotein diacylglycerol transferase